MKVPESVVALDQAVIQHPWSREQWATLGSDLDRLFLWQSVQQFSGFALYRLSPTEELAHLLKLALRPEVQGSGQSILFWAQQEAELKQAGYHRIYLEVATANERAIGFYRKSGFVMLRKIKHFYGDGQDAFSFEKVLDPSI